MPSVAEIIQTQFSGRTVAIVGDLVADQFLSGTIARVSREAPVFIMRHDETETLPGAAANAAANVASLGGKPLLVGVVGRDPNGKALTNDLKRRGIDTAHVVADESITTTTKVRVLGGQPHAARQQVIRIDYEGNAGFTGEVVERLRDRVRSACSIADAIIISDYNYGVASPHIYAEARRASEERSIPLLVDSRFRLSDFTNATAATPNQEEVEQILGKNFSHDACEDLRQRLGLDALLVTNGNRGMKLFERGRAENLNAVGSLNPVDVTGAGDTVIAAFALGLASGLNFTAAAQAANHAGGLVVMKKRTATVSADELLRSIEAQDAFSSPTNA